MKGRHRPLFLTEHEETLIDQCFLKRFVTMKTSELEGECLIDVSRDTARSDTARS
jgi:hypothetical protein